MRVLWMVFFITYTKPSQPTTTPTEQDKQLATQELSQKPPEPYKATDDPKPFIDKPTFLPSKPVPHSPKISPSSIPNPSPSVSTHKPMDPGYPNYGGYLYSIPGYSAFQPISYPGILQPTPTPMQTDAPTDFIPFPSLKETTENKTVEVKAPEKTTKIDAPKPQTDFEEQFTPEIIPAISVPDVDKAQMNESKMCITSLAQGSGATVTIPSQTKNQDHKKKLPERFSLKTSIPISKIDMKCVNNPDPIFQNAATKTKKPATFNPAFQSTKSDTGSKVEIQSNIVIKTAAKEPEVAPATETKSAQNNINTLLNAAEAISKSESQFRKPEPKTDVINEVKDPPASNQNFTPPAATARPLFNPINLDTKVNFPNKTEGNFEQKNQILFIQNKNNTNPKMLLTIQQQNPQVLLQRTNFDSKNLQAPSRLSSQSKKCKDELVENGTSSKVVALKRLHQENCDENDFENLITENQIYGNKIVVKEKSQGTQQEQDLKNKKLVEKPTPADAKNVVLQPNFLYLSNVQFPANLMMIKNNTKVSQTDTNSTKANKVSPNENKATNEVSTMTNTNDVKSPKTQNVTASKDIHVLKSSNNVLQTLSNKSSKSDLVFQAPHQKVIMNSQILYQVPMIVDKDNKLTQPFINNEYSKIISQNKKDTKSDQKANDKVFIACPYQVDTKLQPKIVITNIRPKISKVEEVSSLDVYEKRKRIRRLKYLSHREIKEQKNETNVNNTKKVQDKVDNLRNIITPDKMKAEICKEFSKTKAIIEEGSSDSESDYGEDELVEYNSIIEEYGTQKERCDKDKIEFLAHFRLATHDAYQEKELDRQERAISRDSVASAYITAGRLDILMKDPKVREKAKTRSPSPLKMDQFELELDGIALQKKQVYLSNLGLIQVTPQYRKNYENTWQEVLKERKRRNRKQSDHILKQPRLKSHNLGLDPNNQLQILTEIKKSVNENNNLIKKRLDSSENENLEGDSIHTLAEKNISELNRLSKMADRSVKMITRQDTRKRDLNPGFDSENIQKPVPKIEKPFQNYPQINIPNISKIISLKTQDQTMSQSVTSQATSMDEPQNSAAGQEIFVSTEKTKDFGCQVDEPMPWSNMEIIFRNYREYETARKKEINDLHRRNTALRVEGAHITRAASRDSDCARALLAERQKLGSEEANVRKSLEWLREAIDVVRNYRYDKSLNGLVHI